ncbi:MAG: hypothetical protein IJ333_03735 [Clostridia bacterium]|nr:hypothetical protein [Clostridia bacterium]
MKKISLLIALVLCLTISGVYATWVYSQSDDVADITGAKAITMTEATFTGTYGTYSVDTSKLSMQVDPKDGTAHVTSLVIAGDLTITFTPNTYAPDDVKNNGVASTFAFSLSNSAWNYDNQSIMTVDTNKHNISWVKGNNGIFTYTISAEALADYLTLTEFSLDTKADYDAYDKVLTNGQVVITVSDGKTTATN